jgi:fused signal recognition particle receptor
MIKWLKRNQKIIASSEAPAELTTDESSESLQEVSSSQDGSSGFFARLKQSLSHTRAQFGRGLQHLLLGKKEIDAELLEELETLLLRADCGVETTQMLLDQLRERVGRKQLADGDTLFSVLQSSMQALLESNSTHQAQHDAAVSPLVILMVGVNGAGKTTTIGKLARQYQKQGKRVMLAAGDTFRAAAVEQLQVWGERYQIPVIAQHTGADSASVLYDAFSAAKARGVDVLIADTAGRLHTQSHLMDELKKVKRVLQKIDPTAPHETLLVLDASIGQNALNQARQFDEAVGLTGIVMTKLDGTAKGGILFAIAHELGVPFRYLGIGEGVDDLRDFIASQFVQAIFQDDSI